MLWLVDLHDVVEVEHALRGKRTPPGNRQELPVNRRRWQRTHEAYSSIVERIHVLLPKE